MAHYAIPFNEFVRGNYIVEAGSIEEATKIFNDAHEAGEISEDHFEKVWRDGSEDYYIEEIGEWK